MKQCVSRSRGNIGKAYCTNDGQAASIPEGQNELKRNQLRELAALVRPGQEVVLVDNTSSNDVAALYPEFLKFGVHVVTPNKKAFSSDLTLYERILAAGLESGARFLNEATVGAGLPIISTLKDLVATGDKVGVVSILHSCGIWRGTNAGRAEMERGEVGHDAHAECIVALGPQN